MIPDASLTNAFTNALHAFALFTYFALSLYQYIKGNPYFTSLNIIYTFFILFILKLLGVYVHLFVIYSTGYVVGWSACFILTWLLTFFSLKMVEVPQKIFLGLLALATILCLNAFNLLLLHKDSFFYSMALLTGLVFFVCAYYTQKLVRMGFLLIVLSNITWMVLRANAPFCPANVENPSCNYDNDIYHVMLMFASFLIYYGILHGDMQRKWN